MKPTKKQETGMAITVIAVILLLLFLCSCSTKKSVTEYIYVHDTLTTYRTDTIRDVKYLHHTDTVTNTESHFYTLNNVGDTVREVHYFHNTEKVFYVDSTERYRAVVDSLRAIIDKRTEKTKIKRPAVPIWQKTIFLLAVFLLCVLILKSRNK